jgi:hypothetical protein
MPCNSFKRRKLKKLTELQQPIVVTLERGTIAERADSVLPATSQYQELNHRVRGADVKLKKVLKNAV